MSLNLELRKKLRNYRVHKIGFNSTHIIFFSNESYWGREYYWSMFLHSCFNVIHIFPIIKAVYCRLAYLIYMQKQNARLDAS